MKKLLKIKTLAICAILLAGIIFPTILTAQRSDGFFKVGDDSGYENRNEWQLNNNELTLGGLTGENPTTVPLGSGLLVLSIAGVGYAVVRGKRSHKNTQRMSKGVAVFMALALLLGMTQCKKREMAVETGHKVFITVDVACNTDRTTFIPGTGGDGSFVWTNGKTEFIEVSHGSSNIKHAGYLTGTGHGTNVTTFSGELYLEHDMAKNDKLYFFYLGSSYDGERKTYGDNKTILHITDQNGTMADVTKYHWAIGSAKCTENGQTSFSATLNPVMSILYVNLTGFGDETIRMYGDDVYSIATIDYANGTIVGKKVKGGINLGTQGKKYIAMIPSAAPSTTVKFASNTKEASMVFNCGIKAGKFYSDSGNALAVQGQTAAEPEGVLSGLFSVADGKQVKFSKGNLQYDKQEDKWSFLYPQYTTVETQDVGTDYADQRYVTLFGWGTSGYHDNNDLVNQMFYPYVTSNSSAVPRPFSTGCNGYGPTNANATSTYTMQYLAFYGASTDYDWGRHNAIENGGNAPGKWRVLTHKEWLYLLGPVYGGDTTSLQPCDPIPGTNCRTSSKVNGVDNARFAAAYLLGTTHGIIIFPDNYTHPAGVPEPIGINDYTASSWNANQYNSQEWIQMENAGCVFLPAAGCRNGTTVNSVNAIGYYWMPNHSTTLVSALNVYFQNDQIHPSYCYKKNNKYKYWGSTRSFGMSVRLVRDVN